MVAAWLGYICKYSNDLGMTTPPLTNLLSRLPRCLLSFTNCLSPLTMVSAGLGGSYKHLDDLAAFTRSLTNLLNRLISCRSPLT